MPSPLFPSGQNTAADVQEVASTETQTVESNVGAKDEVQSEERLFKGAEVEQIVRDRINRERKKFDVEKTTYETKLADLQKTTTSPTVSPNLEADFRAKLAAHEIEKKSLTDKLDKYRRETLRGTVERKLVERDCLDPEVAYWDLTTKGIVKLNDDGEIEVENVNNSLEDAVGEYLSKKPHLVRSKSQGGTGSKAPQNVAAVTPEDAFMAAIQSGRPTGKKLFNQG
jgi:hypothetical protein